MALKRTQLELAEERATKIDKQSRRVWLLWICGILIGAIGIKPSGFSAGGLAVTFQRPEVVQGVVYLLCILQAFRVCLQVATRDYRPFVDYRRLIWESLPNKKKTFRDRPKKSRYERKLWMRGFFVTRELSEYLFVMVPVVFILYLSHEKVLEALKAIASGAV